jgi:Zn-dependent protease
VNEVLYLIAVMALPVIVAITFHEAAHGWVARQLGDDTAFRLGRVTFNPIRHIDPFGTLLLPAMLLVVSQGHAMFGYAKPVPVDFGRLRHPRRDMVIVAAAGPATNILLAIVSAALLPLAAEVPPPVRGWLRDTLTYGVLFNVLIAVFNMLPLPPLDGGRVVAGLLPPPLAAPFARLERYGFLILLAALFLLPPLGRTIGVDLDLFQALVAEPARWLSSQIFGLVAGR